MGVSSPPKERRAMVTHVSPQLREKFTAFAHERGNSQNREAEIAIHAWMLVNQNLTDIRTGVTTLDEILHLAMTRTS